MVCAPAASGPPRRHYHCRSKATEGWSALSTLAGRARLPAWARTGRPGLPVLCITGYSDNAEHVADESTVLLKPVPEEALLATVARMLGTLC